MYVSIVGNTEKRPTLGSCKESTVVNIHKEKILNIIFYNKPIKVLETSTLNPQNIVKGKYFPF